MTLPPVVEWSFDIEVSDSGQGKLLFAFTVVTEAGCIPGRAAIERAYFVEDAQGFAPDRAVDVQDGVSFENREVFAVDVVPSLFITEEMTVDGLA